MMNNTKRKDWIKNAAIVFLSVMLILTLFSNTIMNYSLPEVAAQYMYSDTITAKVRGTGTVESLDPYEVKASQSRVIASVAVTNGTVVQKGDTLFVLEDKESEELIEAEKALEDMMLQFEQALLTGEISAQVFQNAQNSNTLTAEEYQAQINQAQAAIDAAQAQVTNLTNQLNTLEHNTQLLPYGTEAQNKTKAESELAAAEQNLENAKSALESLKSELAVVEATIEEYSVDVSGNVTGTTSKEEYDKAVARQQELVNTEIPKAEENVTQNTKNVANKKSVLTNATNAYTKLENDYSVQKINLTTQLNNATTNLEALKTNKQTIVSNISQELQLASQNDALKEQKAKIDELRAESVGTTITAPITGTITGINVTAGTTTVPDTALATILPEGKGYSLSFSVTKDQAKRVSIGDVAEIQNSWYYSDVTAVLSKIKVDPANPSTNQLLTFDITGEVVAGQNLSLSVGQKSSMYDMVVPNSAIREDSNGKFILIVEAKSSPLGNRYFAERVDVEVIASDDTKSAISGALEGWEYVITTSNKPVESGKQVRLAE